MVILASQLDRDGHPTHAVAQTFEVGRDRWQRLRTGQLDDARLLVEIDSGGRFRTASRPTSLAFIGLIAAFFAAMVVVVIARLSMAR